MTLADEPFASALTSRGGAVIASVAMSWRVRWLLISPVVLMIASAFMVGTNSCSSGSSGGPSPTPAPGFAIQSIIVYAGGPPSQTPTASPTQSPHGPSPTVTRSPTPTAMPTAAPTSVVQSGTVAFGAQAAEVLDGHTRYRDVTDFVLWNSSDPNVVVPPVAGEAGVFTGGTPGCACISASASDITGNEVSVGVFAVDNPPPICPECPTPLASAIATPHQDSTPISESAPAGKSAGVLRWTEAAGAPLRGPIATGPNGSIYFITTDGVLHGLDAAGKTILNQLSTGTAPAVLPDGSVAAMAGASTLAAYAPGGGIKWQVDIGSAGALTASAGAIYASAGSEVVSVSLNGRLNWRIEAGAATVAAATANGVVIANAGGAVTAIDDDGAIQWTFTPTGGFSGSIAVADNVVYAGSAIGTLYAIDLRSGGELWHIDPSGASTKLTAISGPAAGSGTIFFGAGAARAVSADGQVKWVQAGITTGNGPVVAAGGNQAFFTGTDGLGAMLAGDGGFIWTSHSFGMIAQAAVSPVGTLYIANSDGRIFAVR